MQGVSAQLKRAGLLAICIVGTAAGQSAIYSRSEPPRIVVPARVAGLVTPVLDEQLKLVVGSTSDESKVSKRLIELIRKRGEASDEALVVLMCFKVGESQEEIDGVIRRGRRMLPLLSKYQNADPVFRNRKYPDSMHKRPTSKAEAFQGAMNAIKHGWRGTYDNPEGQ